MRPVRTHLLDKALWRSSNQSKTAREREGERKRGNDERRERERRVCFGIMAYVTVGPTEAWEHTRQPWLRRGSKQAHRVFPLLVVLLFRSLMTRHEEKGPDGGIGACWCSCDEHASIQAFCKGKPSCLECSSGTICGVWIRERAQRKEKSNQVHIDTF